jgi:hypothetical protein
VSWAVPDPTPEDEPAELRFSRVARDVTAPNGQLVDVLVQCWSDGSFTCALRATTTAIRTWLMPSDMEEA